jgi:hypothetical protein
MTLIAAIDQLCTQAEQALPSEAQTLHSIRSRLTEPLRVAIAGRVKAGKSTLLNALVGERLAPTDAGECTRLVTWYRHGLEYQVTARLFDGATRLLDFDRTNGQLNVDLGDLAIEDVERLDVHWPARRLTNMTLIDTPGLEGMDDQAAARTRRLLGIDHSEHTEVDAVIYLMRHMHRYDADFLESFMDRSMPHPSPVNALAVLSRADEIGAGQREALDLAGSVANRYAADQRIQAICASVVPVAGLIAETGVTFRESEAASLRSLAGLSAEDVDGLLLSVDHFVDPAVSPLASETRRDLLIRLGIFGARFCIDELRSQDGVAAAGLAEALIEASGIYRLRVTLLDQFERRSTLLKARSALANLRRIASNAHPTAPEVAALQRSIEQLESSAQELAQLRLLHLVLSGSVQVSDEERTEIARLVSQGDPATRLGATETEAETLPAIARAAADRWRAKGSSPLAERTLSEACDIVVHCYEDIHAQLEAGEETSGFNSGPPVQ